MLNLSFLKNPYKIDKERSGIGYAYCHTREKSLTYICL